MQVQGTLNCVKLIAEVAKAANKCLGDGLRIPKPTQSGFFSCDEWLAQVQLDLLREIERSPT